MYKCSYKLDESSCNHNAIIIIAGMGIRICNSVANILRTCLMFLNLALMELTLDNNQLTDYTSCPCI